MSLNPSILIPDAVVMAQQLAEVARKKKLLEETAQRRVNNRKHAIFEAVIRIVRNFDGKRGVVEGLVFIADSTPLIRVAVDRGEGRPVDVNEARVFLSVSRATEPVGDPNLAVVIRRMRAAAWHDVCARVLYRRDLFRDRSVQVFLRDIARELAKAVVEHANDALATQLPAMPA